MLSVTVETYTRLQHSMGLVRRNYQAFMEGFSGRVLIHKMLLFQTCVSQVSQFAISLSDSVSIFSCDSWYFPLYFQSCLLWNHSGYSLVPQNKPLFPCKSPLPSLYFLIRKKKMPVIWEPVLTKLSLFIPSKYICYSL